MANHMPEQSGDFHEDIGDASRWEATAACSKAFEWRKWQNEIPFIRWPSSWEVKAVPPFAGAVIRYWVRHKDDHDAHVSVYLDCYNQLGIFGVPPKPHWEIYPDKYDNNLRFDMSDISGLISAIKASINSQRREK